MTVNTYDIGDAVICEATFKNEAGAVTNPTSVVFKYELPDGTETTETWPGDADITNPSTGTFRRVVQPTMSGRHTYRFNGAGAVIAAVEQVFIVRRSAF